MKYYKVRETFKETIGFVSDAEGVYEPATETGSGLKNQKSPLDEISEKINEKYEGDFTEGDKVVIIALQQKHSHNGKSIDIAQTSNSQTFAQSVFLIAFSKAALECFNESEKLIKDSLKVKLNIM